MFENFNPTPLDLNNGLSRLLYQTRKKNPLVYNGKIRHKIDSWNAFKTREK